MEPAVRELLNSPKLALHVEHFAQILEREREKRERFFADVSESEKAEFINGEVIVHSPAKKRHTDVIRRLLHLLDLYVQQHDLGYVGHEKVFVSLTRNDYEPDICFFRRDKADAFTPDQMKFPAPDFVAEVLSPSTEHTDRTIKFEDYAAHGVGEYWLLDPVGDIIEQYVLENERYLLRMKSATGEVASAVVEGFAIPVQALFDDAANLAEVQRIVRAG